MKPRRLFPGTARRVGLPLAVGSGILLLAGVSVWPPWTAVVAVALASGAVPWWRASRNLRAAETPIYAMHNPIRPVAAHGVPDDASYTVQVAIHSQHAVLIAPSEATGPEGRRVPLTGHNLSFTLTAGASPAVIREITAVVTAHTSFPSTVALGISHPEMPVLVMSSDLLESSLRSAAAYRPLRPPDVALFLDKDPVDITVLREDVATPPFDVLGDNEFTLVFAPVTDRRHWLHWQLIAEIECEGRTDKVFWDLALTAETGMAMFHPHGGKEWCPIYALHSDHWDPRNPDPFASDEIPRKAPVIAHTSADGQGRLTRPVRPGPEPESPTAAELREQGDTHAEAGRLEEAETAYREAADAGSGAAAYALGILVYRRDDFWEARDWYRLAAARRVPNAFNNVGMVSFLLGEHHEAEHWFRRAMDEGDWTGAVNLAVLLVHQGDHAQAEIILTLAQRVDVPRSAQLLSSLMIQQGRAEEAEQVLTWALDRHGSDYRSFGPADPEELTDILLQLARLALTEHDDLHGALARLREAVDAAGSPDALLPVVESLDRLTVDLAGNRKSQPADIIEVAELRFEAYNRLFLLAEET